MLDVEREFFEQKREDFLKAYPGKYVLIKGREVIGSFDTIQDALSAGAREFGTEPFLARRTDEPSPQISIPALALGILGANPNLPIER